MAATIKDIATSAGVSIATVSNVLNGKQGEFGDETRGRVIDAARRLGYHRNRVARNLVRRSSECLGVTFVDQNLSLGENYYLVEVLDGIVQSAYALGYNVSLHTRIRSGHEAEHLPELLDRQSDGLCVIAPHSDSPLISLLAVSPVPVVFIGSEDPYPGVNWIDVDNAAGARMAAEHLLSLGHTRIAHLSGHPRQRAARTRSRAFYEYVTALGAQCEIVACAAFDRMEARSAARDLLARPDRPTAIFAANDGMAIGTLQAAAERGIRVPEELSVIGFDDMREAAITDPPLTTVRQPMRGLGQRAAEWMIDRLKGKNGSRLAEFVTPRLVVRGSTATPTAP
jgi:LacI family transcriptional regulator